jgi:hypothetical protein
MRILRGNDVIVKWTINFNTGGLTTPVDFSKSTLTVYFVDSYGKRKVEHTVDKNVISVHIGGEIQRLGTCYLDAYWQYNDNNTWHRAKVNNVIEFVDNPESINFDNFIPDVDIITIGCVSDVVFGGSYIANFDNYYTKSEVDELIKTGGGGGGTKNYLELSNRPFDLVNNDWQSTKHVSFPTGGFFGAYNTGVSGASIDGDGNAEVGTLIVRSNKIIIGGKEFNPSDAAITQETFDKLLEKWWKYDEENKAIYSTYNVYSTGSVTAKGINKTGGGGGSNAAISTLVDVTLTTLADKDVLIYNSTNKHWENKPQSSIIPDLSKYVTLNTAQSITGIKTFIGSNFNFYHEDGYLNIVQKSSYTGGWARGLNFKNDNNVQYAVIGGYGNANTFNYVYIGQSYDSRWITFASTGVKSNVDLEATKFKKTGGTSTQFLKADGSVDSSTYLTTGVATYTYVKVAGDEMTGALSVPNLVISSTDGVKHIAFSRTNYNYITAPGNSSLAFVMHGKTISSTSADFVITNNGIFPGTTGIVTNGRSTERWSNIYSVLGNFSGVITAGSHINATGNITAGGTVNAGSDVVANNYVKATNGWFQNDVAQTGLYNKAGDARWMWNGSYWYADKDVYSTNTIAGTRLISTIANGTAPLTVTSTTLVNNLNADLLDNYHASGLATANSVVIRDGNNYTYLKYINSSTNTDENGDLDQFIVTKPNDSFYRKYGRDYVRTQLNNFSVNRQTIDLTKLNADTYYPCSIAINALEPTTIKIFVSLNSGSKPSWSTRTSGFTMNLSWQVFGGGWGSTSIQRKIFNNSWQSTSNNVHPCGGIEQNIMTSTEIVYLRGGAKYFYTISNNENKFVVNSSGYSWSSSTYSYSAPLISTPKKSPSLCYEENSMLGAYNMYCNYFQTYHISVDDTITATTFRTKDNNLFEDGRLELSGSTPYIDFHFNNSSSDYTNRIIAATANRIDITSGLQVNGKLTTKSKILSTVASTASNNWNNLSTLTAVLAVDTVGVIKDSCQPIFRWANQITEGYLTRYIIGSARAVGNAFGQLRLWVGNNDSGTSGNWFALNNNGVVSTSLTYFETGNVGFKTGNAIFGSTVTTVAEVSSSTNEIIFSSGLSNIHVNYRASGVSRTIPTAWYWHSGSSSNWCSFEIGAFITHGNASIKGNIAVEGNVDAVGDIGSTGSITSTRMLTALGGLEVTDFAMFNDSIQIDGNASFNNPVTISALLNMNGNVTLNGIIRGNSSSRIICDGIAINSSNKESGCIVAGNPNVWNIAIDHNDIQARNNGIWSEIYINDYGGNVFIGALSYTTTIKSLNTVLGGSDNTSLTIGRVKLVYDRSNNALKVVAANGGVANFYSTGSLTAKGINTGKQDLVVNGTLYCNNRGQFNVNSNEGSRIDFLNPQNTILGNSGMWTLWGNMGNSYNGALEFWIYPGSGSSYSNSGIFSLRPNGSATLKGTLSQNVGSDIRLKTNKDYDVDYCEKLLSLGRIFDYNYNDKAREINAPGYDNNKHTGLMYHKVKDIMPHITRVFHEDYGGIDYTHTDYINLIAGATQMTILGLRKLIGITNKVKDDIVELKKRLNKVEKENEELKKKLALLESK